MHTIIDFIVESVSAFGYFGIFFMMFLESSFIPFPSEVVMIPAGFLAHQGEINFFIAILCGILGSLGGALLNYYLALYFGRELLIKWGKYFFFNEKTMVKMENFFDKHGHISTFSGRLIPVVRQYISLPAGLGKMSLPLFCFYTSLGAGIWVIILTALGYFLGQNEAILKEYLHLITIALILLVSVGIYIYIYLWRKKQK
ncbi:DedA family protein [Helicobacter turcicus]|uniref:DedA family protein n=1 Tax=Helicobacter turcicus TaxID=2867412 RepID=A0ABS7JLB8_9HELI|nr:DedA family protein [Helicobacter turcicus]MBX7490200.1 DedA family protein [Helicobacter turcicus]MBX7545221.1 DedA family protein [Helicobacter turcicus]